MNSTDFWNEFHCDIFKLLILASNERLINNYKDRDWMDIQVSLYVFQLNDRSITESEYEYYVDKEGLKIIKSGDSFYGTITGKKYHFNEGRKKILIKIED